VVSVADKSNTPNQFLFLEEHMPLMLYHTVQSQLIRIRKTDLTHSTLKRLIRCSSIPIFVSQNSFFSSKNATKILNYIIAPTLINH